MATANYSWTLPTVGGSEDSWGAENNTLWDDLDTLLGGVNATEFAILDGATVTTAELNVLDGVTATTAELNILDGVTANATEINYLDGKTLSGSDTELITGTAGTSGDIVQWNADGDLVSYGAATQATATWEAGTGTTESLVSPAKVKAAVDAALQVKAWVNFNGTGTVAIRESFNVSSITDNGTGLYTINFTDNMPDANYAVSGSIGEANTNAIVGVYESTTVAKAAGAVQVVTAGTGGLFDSSQVSVAIFR